MKKQNEREELKIGDLVEFRMSSQDARSKYNYKFALVSRITKHPRAIVWNNVEDHGRGVRYYVKFLDSNIEYRFWFLRAHLMKIS